LLEKYFINVHIFYRNFVKYINFKNKNGNVKNKEINLNEKVYYLISRANYKALIRIEKKIKKIYLINLHLIEIKLKKFEFHFMELSNLKKSFLNFIFQNFLKKEIKFILKDIPNK
jgi:hypothetical protein